MDEQPDGNRPSIPTWVWIVTIFVIIFGLQLFLSGRFTSGQDVPMTKFIEVINGGQVDEIVVTDNKLEAINNGELVTFTTKDSQQSYTEALAFYGLTGDKLEELNVAVTVNDQSIRNNLFSIVLTLGPILLLIWIFSRGFRQMQGGGGNSIFGFGRSRARNLNDADRPTVTFDDVAGDRKSVV